MGELSVPKKNKITINLSEVALFTLKAGELALTPTGEEALNKLLALRDIITQAIEGAKSGIKQSVLAFDPNFKSLKTDNYTIMYQFTGKRYEIDDSPEECDAIVPVVSYKVDSKKLEEFLEREGRLPRGVREVEREKTIVIRENR